MRTPTLRSEAHAADLAELLEIVLACGQTCAACADACLGAGSPDLLDCVGLDLACADVCATTARVLARSTGRDTEVVRALLQACAVASAACADECVRHTGTHRHCGTCAEMCRLCDQRCRAALVALG
jgi:hypothetical protein